MKICPNCQFPNHEGALHCARCGVLMEKAAATRRLHDQNGIPGKPRWGTAHFGRDDVLVMHIRNKSEPLVFRVPADGLVIGRRDPDTGLAPDVDLEPFGAIELGVSRRHAAIRPQHDDTLMIEDLGSANATYLNGQRLVPYQPRVLRDGDELRLGRFVMRVYFRGVEGDATEIEPW